MDQVQGPARQQQLPEPSGVGKIGLNGLPAEIADDKKAIRPPDESGLQDGR